MEKREVLTQRFYAGRQKTYDQLSKLEQLEIDAYMEEQGFQWQELKVVKFHDKLEDRPWFYRDFDSLGTLTVMCDGCVPCDPKEVLRIAYEMFGPDSCVLW